MTLDEVKEKITKIDTIIFQKGGLIQRVEGLERNNMTKEDCAILSEDIQIIKGKLDNRTIKLFKILGQLAPWAAIFILLLEKLFKKI